MVYLIYMNTMTAMNTDVIDVTTGRIPSPRVRSHQDKFIKYYIERFGVISDAATCINMDREVYYDWSRRYPEFVKRIEEADEVILQNLRENDVKNVYLVEEALVTNATKKLDTAAQKFYLKNRRPDRWRNDTALINLTHNANQLTYINEQVNQLIDNKSIKKLAMVGEREYRPVLSDEASDNKPPVSNTYNKGDRGGKDIVDIEGGSTHPQTPK